MSPEVLSHSGNVYTHPHYAYFAIVHYLKDMLKAIAFYLVVIIGHIHTYAVASYVMMFTNQGGVIASFLEMIHKGIISQLTMQWVALVSTYTGLGWIHACSYGNTRWLAEGKSTIGIRKSYPIVSQTHESRSMISQCIATKMICEYQDYVWSIAI